jgi:hypothetical protein
LWGRGCYEPGSGHGQTLGTGLEREHFSGHDPGNRAPRTGEEENVDADESDGGALRREISRARDSTGNRDDVWNEMSV